MGVGVCGCLVCSQHGVDVGYVYVFVCVGVWVFGLQSTWCGCRVSKYACVCGCVWVFGLQSAWCGCRVCICVYGYVGV